MQRPLSTRDEWQATGARVRACVACDLIVIVRPPGSDPSAQCASCGVDGYGAAHGVDPQWRADVAVPVLVELLGHGEGPVRRRAARAILGIGESARSAVPALLGTLAADRELRPLAMQALARMGPEAVPALIPLLRAALDFTDPQRELARRAVCAIATPGLRLRRSAEVRRRCSAALASLGVAAAEAAPALLQALRDDVVAVRRAAAWALTRVRPEPAVVLDGLVDAATRDDDAAVRRMALHGIGQLGVAAAAAGPAVAAVLKHDTDPFARRRAAGVVERIGAAPGVLVPALVEALADADPKVRRLAAAALGRQGGAARAGVPSLVRAIFRDAARSVRRRAASALERVDPEARTAVAGLIQALVEPGTA